MDYRTGDVVKSVAGHDKGIYYIVVAEAGEYVFVANGKTRLADYPKRKKKKHLLYAGRIEEPLAVSLSERSGAFCVKSKTGDSELRKILKTFGYGKDYD